MSTCVRLVKTYKYKLEFLRIEVSLYNIDSDVIIISIYSNNINNSKINIMLNVLYCFCFLNQLRRCLL